MKYVPVFLAVVSLFASYYFVFKLGQRYQQNRYDRERIESEMRAGEKNAETVKRYDKKISAIGEDDSPAASVIVDAIDRL